MSGLGKRIYNKTTTVAFIIARTRLWSRLGMIAYMFLLNQMVFWVFGLPDITTAQTVIISIITGLSTPLTAFYLRSGQELYRVYANLQYSNRTIAFIDHIGYTIDKFRLFPLLLVVYYSIMLYLALQWGMSLGDALSGQQAAFLTTFSSSTSIIFGFFITSGEVNMKLEEAYKERHSHVKSERPEADDTEIQSIINKYIDNFNIKDDP